MAHYELKGETWVRGHGDEPTEFTLSGNFNSDLEATSVLSEQVTEMTKSKNLAYTYSIYQGGRFLDRVYSEGLWNERDFGIVTIR